MATYQPIYQLDQYDQGDEGGDMDFIVRWKDAPAGSMVSFHAMVDPSGGPVTLPLTTISTPSGAMGVQQSVQAGYRSTLVLAFFYQSPLPPTFKISLRAQFVPFVP